MKLLDRYLLKKFVYAFLFVLFALALIITLIDFTEKNEDFLYHDLGYKEIFDYYLFGYIPFIVNFITPISVFVTTVFITSRLAQHTEIVALLSSGVSFLRFLIPYLVVAIGITLCSFILTGWVLANANKTRVAFETRYIERFAHGRSQHIHIRISPVQYFYVARYWSYNNSGMDVIIETIKDNQLVERLSAKQIKWLAEEQIWLLQDCTLRKIDGLQEHIQQDHTLRLALDIHPSDFNINPKLHETLTLPALSAQIKDLKNKGAENVHIFLTEKYVRYMSPFSAIILTVIGVLVSARKTRRGMGLQLALGFILAFVYIACFLFAKGVAEARGTHLFVTVWTPNLVFSMLGIILYRFMPK